MPARIPHPKIIFGTALFGPPSFTQAKVNTPEAATALLDLFYEYGHKELDTARAYPVGCAGGSEALLGSLSPPLHERFELSSKVTSWIPGSHTTATIDASVTGTLAALNAPRVHIMYLHAPDRTTPFAETCRAMDRHFRDGRFEKFGISNYTVDEVEEIVAICKREGLVRPSVYQGQYNAITRAGEKELFPVLRKHGIAFYAYSPAAGGFFSGHVSKKSADDAGSRWDSTTVLGRAYQRDYFKEALFDAADKVCRSATAAGLTGHAVALRWALYHSTLDVAHGDGVIIGASSTKQLKQNLDTIEQGPLPQDLVKELDAVWGAAEKDSAHYHV